MSTRQSTRISERRHVLHLGAQDQQVLLTNDQKQTLAFVVDSEVPDFEEVVRSQVVLESKIGRFVLESNVTVSPEAFLQIASLDYSFFRYGAKSPTTVVLPANVDKLGFNIHSKDQGRTWLVDELVLFDTE